MIIKIMKKLKKALNRKGMSMVSVILAFVILLILVAAFTQTVRMANNVVKNSNEIRNKANESFSDYYSEKGDFTQEKLPGGGNFKLENEKDANDGFSFDANVYSHTDENIRIYTFDD